MKVLLVSLILFQTFLQGYGIRCTVGAKVFAESQIPVQAVQTLTCPSGQNACFTARYSITVQGKTVSAVSGMCMKDVSKTCPSEDFCNSFKQTLPSSSNCKGKCCYTDNCNKGEILNAAGHMFQASIFIAIFNAFTATKLMG